MLRVNISGLIAPTLTQLKAAHVAATVTAKLAAQGSATQPRPAPKPVDPATLAREAAAKLQPYVVPPVATPGSTGTPGSFKPIKPTTTPAPVAPPVPAAPVNPRDAYTEALAGLNTGPTSMANVTKAWDAYRKTWTGAPKDYAEATRRVQDANSWNKLDANKNNQYTHDWLNPKLQEEYAKAYASSQDPDTKSQDISPLTQNPEFANTLLGDFAGPARMGHAMGAKNIDAMNQAMKDIGDAAYEKALGGVAKASAPPELLQQASQAAIEAQNSAKAWNARRAHPNLSGWSDVGGTLALSNQKELDARLAKSVDAEVLKTAKTRVTELQQNGTAMSSSMKNVGILDAIKQNPQILMVAGGLLAMMFGGKTGLILGGLAAAFGGKGLYDKFQNMQSVPVQKRYGEITDNYAKLKKVDPTGKQAEAYIAEVEKSLTSSSGNPELDKVNNGVHSIFTVQSMFPDYVASQMSSAAQEQVAPFVGNEAAQAAFAPPQAAK